MTLAIGGIHSTPNPEYMRILAELRKLGISPSGNLGTDKARLEQAKTELVQKIQTKHSEEEKQSLQVQPLEGVMDVQDTKRTQMEEERLGAMTVAELNKFYFGL